MKQTDTSITVALRVRPLTENERTRCIASIINQAPTNPKVVIIGERGFSFDHVFINEGQEAIFNLLMTPVIEKSLEGVNCSVIAYGQTGTGKTYTMGTEPQDFADTLNSGLISRTAERLIEHCCSSDNTLTISVSFVEIYNEEVFELLTDQPMRLDVKGFQIRGLTCVPVKTMDEVCSLLCKGTNNRHTRPTLLNSSSSRSHAIFTFRLCRRIGNDVLLSELHMVDLAGSERAKRTGTRDDAFQEAVCINRGLLELGNVIQSLSSGRHGNHVPYRNSLLTSVLHGSLQVQNMIAMIACVSPSELDMSETLNTLRFVEKSKKVMQAIEINKVIKLHKNKPISNSSTIRPKYPLAPYNYQYSSITGNERSKQCVSGTSSCLYDSVSSLNTEENISSKMSDCGGFISPIVKKCCDQIESNLNEKIEQVVLTTIQKEKKTRRCIADNVSSMFCSPLLNGSRELLPLSNDRKTVFRKEIEKFQEQMREAMKSEMRTIIQEEIRVALTNTICSTVEVLQKKKSSSNRGAPLLCRRLDFDHTTATAASEENGRQVLSSTPLPFPFISLQNEKRQGDQSTPKKESIISPKRYGCISDSFGCKGTGDTPADCRRGKISNVETVKTRPRRSARLSVKYLNNVQESVSQTNSVHPTLNGSLSTLHKNFDMQNTPILKRTNPGQIYVDNYDPSIISLKRYGCISDSFGCRGTGDTPADCRRGKISNVGTVETRSRRSARLSVKYLNNVQESVSQTNSVHPTLNGSLSTLHKNFDKQNTPILRRTNPGQIYVDNYDPDSQYSDGTEIFTAHHNPLSEQKSTHLFDSALHTGDHDMIPTQSDTHSDICQNHHLTRSAKARCHEEEMDNFTAHSSHKKSSSQLQQQNTTGSNTRFHQMNFQSPKVAEKNKKKGRTRKIKHNKSPFKRESIKTPQKIVRVKKLVALNVGNNVHQAHMNRVMSILNTGSTRELEKLPTIGPKTALIINNYRNLSGEIFESVDDLRKIPGLNKNFHERFALANLVI